MVRADYTPLLLYNGNSRPKMGPISYSFNKKVPFDEGNKFVKAIWLKVKIDGVINFGDIPIWPDVQNRQFRVHRGTYNTIYWSN
jgi:hypothetical protein